MSWYDGLTFEQVRERLISGDGVPNYNVPGGIIHVPDGYHGWLYSTHRTTPNAESRTIPFITRSTHQKEG